MPHKQTIGNLALQSFDDIFLAGSAQPDSSQVVEIPLSDLHPPEFHPFMVNDDDAMFRLTESVLEYGVREPGLARPRAAGGFELLCGNRRKRACELAGKTTMPVIIRDMDSDSAVIAMVESNLEQRERILPSERAWAYRVMMEALNHNGIKAENLSYETMTERTGVKKSQLFRFIRLTELILTLLDKVDANQLAFSPAVELSYLSVQEQTEVASAMELYAIKPSLSQAVRLKKMKQDGTLTVKAIDEILSEEKKTTKESVINSSQFLKYFPPDYSQKQMGEVIEKLLKDWKAGLSI